MVLVDILVTEASLLWKTALNLIKPGENSSEKWQNRYWKNRGLMLY
jgi:hypothetical protein